MPLPRLLILPALAALLALALPASPASADSPACSCAADFPLESPDLCYVAPGARVADFAFTAPSDFLQVVGFGAGGYCRHNAAFSWIDGPEVLACEEFVGCACSTPTFGTEICGNGIDDDCDGEVDTIAGERFEDRGATVFDCSTNLEWEKKTAGTVNATYTRSPQNDGPNGTAFTVFLPAVATALGGTVCDHTSWSCSAASAAATDSPTCTPTAPPDGCWRLPEIDELKTILDAARPGCGSGTPCIDEIFDPTAPRPYWSATSGGPITVWGVGFDVGILVGGGTGDSSLWFRAVRSSP